MMRAGLTTALVVVLSACWANRIPPALLTRYEASVSRAEALGALGLPAARLHLELARQQAATAKLLAAGGDSRSGVVMARAQVDAEVSLSMAREVSMHVCASRVAADLLAIQDNGGP
jgi:hypothetical protein